MLSTAKDPPKVKVKIISQYDDHIPEFYRTFHCNFGNVQEALASEADYFTARDPTLIVAPTGSYKSTFALLELVSRAIKNGKNVLIILNRVGLAVQLKQKVMEVTNSPLLGCLTDKGLQEMDHFGCVCVITYHRLPAFVNDPTNAVWIENMMYVVADEIHFIVSDSSFNEKCSYYLDLLTQKFQHAIRVYMTATEWDVLLPLAEAEKKNYLDCTRAVYPWVSPREFRRYVFPADYSHVSLHFFSDMQEIIEKINQNPNEKWIVFVSSKKKGKALAKELEERAIYLDADSKGTEEWHQLLKDNKFQQQVLITTPVLDCGVNVIDDKLCNIVIVTDERTRLIQMLGRKRCQRDEYVNLYVYDMDEKTIVKRYQDCEALCQWLDRYTGENFEGRRKLANEIWCSQQDNLRHYFHLVKGYLVPNALAFFALKRKMNFYESILSGEITFQQAVRGWLGHLEEDVSAAEKLSLKEKIDKFCEEHLEQELTADEIVKLRAMVSQIKKPSGASKTRADRLETIGKRAVSSRLEDIDCPYRVARNAWKIIKHQEE